MRFDSAAFYIRFMYVMHKVLILLTLVMMSVLLSSCENDKTAAKEVAHFIHSAETYEGQGQFRAAILEAKNAIRKLPAG